MIKTKVAFLENGFYTVNQSNLKNFKKALIGWKIVGPPKSRFCFDHVNRLLPFVVSAIALPISYFQ